LPEHGEFETVTVKVPKGILQLLRDFTENPQAWMERAIVQTVECELDGDLPEKDCLICKASVLKKYNLEKVFNS
jgi:hypothetical protein